MRDRAEVIKGLEVCVSREPGGDYICYKCPYEIDGNDCEINSIKDAIALLKEQEYKDKMFHALEEDWKLLKEQPEIVRCKDCKHRPTAPENKEVGPYLVFPDEICPCQIDDEWYSWMPEDDWFCAGGERR